MGADDPMTPAACDRVREKCLRDTEKMVDAKIVTALAPLVRVEGKVDGLVERMDALSRLYDRVGALEVWKGVLNGRAQSAVESAHAHHRDAEVAERLHTRMEDVLAATEAAVVAMNHRASTTTTTTTTAPSDSLPSLPRWAVIGLAGFVVLALALAMIGGERGLWTVKPHLQAPATTAK